MISRCSARNKFIFFLIHIVAIAALTGCNRPAGDSGGETAAESSKPTDEGKVSYIPDTGAPNELSDELKMLILDDPFGKGVGLRSTLEEAVKVLLPGESPSQFREGERPDWSFKLDCTTWDLVPMYVDVKNYFAVYGTFGATKNPVNQITVSIDMPGAEEHGSFVFIGKITEKSTLEDVEKIFGKGFSKMSPDGSAYTVTYVFSVSPSDTPGRTHMISVIFVVNKGANVRMVQLIRK